MSRDLCKLTLHLCCVREYCKQVFEFNQAVHSSRTTIALDLSSDSCIELSGGACGVRDDSMSITGELWSSHFTAH